MPSAPLDRIDPWRFDELADLPEDDRRYEVVDGHLVVSPPPSQWHQHVSLRLFRQLLPQCPDEWDVVVEFALPLGADGRVPDLAVVRADAPIGRGRPPYPVGPEYFGLVGEVVSPDSRKTDRFAKPGEYAEAGIGIFWRVETEPDLIIMAFRLSGDGYVEVARVTGRGRLPVPWGEAEIDLDLIDPDRR